MRRSSLFGGVLALTLALASQGCATRNAPPPKQVTLDADSTVWRAPLVLRPATFAVNTRAPTRTGYTSGLGDELLAMSITGLLTFGGAWLAAPDVLERHKSLVLDLPPACADRWVELTVTNPPRLFDPPQARNTALELLEAAIRLDLARRGRELTLEVEPSAAANPQGAQALEAIGRRLAAPMLVVADVSFGIEPEPRTCSMRMQVSAEMHLASPGTEVKSIQRIMLERATSLSVVRWAKDPDVGSQALRSLMDQLGTDVLDALPKPPPG